MKLIEFFKWDHEGEYQQYFYVVEDEKKFVKEVLEYLNTVQIKKDYSWGNCLVGFKEEQSVEPYFLKGYVEHLNEYYYIEDSYGKNFSLEKTSQKQEKVVIKWKD